MGSKSRSVLLSVLLIAPVILTLVGSPGVPLAEAAQADNPAVQYSESKVATMWGAEGGTPAGVSGAQQVIFNFPPSWPSFPFWSTRYSSATATSDGRICLGSTVCSPSMPSEAALMNGPPTIAPAWIDPAFVHLAPPVVEYASDHSWLRVRWSEAGFGDSVRTEAFDALLYRDGRIRFDYGPDNIGQLGVSGIASGAGSDPSLVWTHQDMRLDLAYTQWFHPFVPGIDLVQITQPGPGELWVNGERAGTITGISHAIVVGPMLLKAESALLENVVIKAGGQTSPAGVGGTQMHWSPDPSAALVTVTAEGQESDQIDAIDVLVLNAVDELLAYRVDILTPTENQVFESDMGYTRGKVSVPLTWAASSQGCPVRVSFYELTAGQKTGGTWLRDVDLGLANQQTQLDLSLTLRDSSRARVRAAISADSACSSLMESVGGAPPRLVGDVTPPFVVDTDGMYVQLQPDVPETKDWRVTPPEVRVVGYRAMAVPAWLDAPGAQRFHYVFDDFEQAGRWSQVSEPYGGLDAPHHRARTFLAHGASTWQITGTDFSTRPAAGLGDTFSFWVRPEAVTADPAPSVRVWIGDTLIIESVVTWNAWTLLSSVLLPEGSGGDVRIQVTSTSGFSAVSLDAMAQTSSAALTTEGENALSTITLGGLTGDAWLDEQFALHYYLDMTRPHGTAEALSFGGWIPISPQAVPGTPATADVTILPHGEDAHSGVTHLRLVGDDGRTTVPPIINYETQVPWAFVVPWDGEKGAWVTAFRYVDVWFIDAAGLESQRAATATVQVDGTRPLIREILPRTWVGTKTPVLSVSAEDPDSGVASGSFTVHTIPAPGTQPQLVGVFPATYEDGRLTGSVSVQVTGNYSVNVTARDVAGNVANSVFTLQVDLAPPVVTFGAEVQFTRTPFTNVSLLATDRHSGLDAQRVGEDPDGLTWEPYAGGVIGIDLSDGDGSKTIRAQVRDHAANVGYANVTVTLDTRGPNVTAVSPRPSSTGNSVLGVEVKGSWEDDKSVTQNVAGVDTTGVFISWYDGLSGSTEDITNDPRMKVTASGFTYTPVLAPGTFYQVFVAKSDKAGNWAYTDWWFWTA